MLRERPPPSSSKLPQHQGKSRSRTQVGPHPPFAPPASHPPTSFAPPRSILHSHSAQSPGVEGGRTRMTRKSAGIKMWKLGRCYRHTWICCPSSLAYHLEKIRTCQSLPVYRAIEGCWASTRGRILSPPWWPHRHQRLLLFPFHTIPNARSPFELQYSFGQ